MLKSRRKKQLFKLNLYLKYNIAQEKDVNIEFVVMGISHNHQNQLITFLSLPQTNKKKRIKITSFQKIRIAMEYEKLNGSCNGGWW